MLGGELYGTTRSTTPLSPNPRTDSPVVAFNASSRRPAVTKMRAGMLGSPGQYVTPRFESRPPWLGGTSYFQISFPVAASRARTRFSAGRYMTPLMTSGVTSDNPPNPPAAGLFRSARYGMLHASFSFETLEAVICFKGE